MSRLWFLTGVVMPAYSGMTWCVSVLWGIGSAGPGYMPKYPAPTAEATALGVQHTERISDATTQLMYLTSVGSFKAARSKDPGRSARARGSLSAARPQR
jgi:hypothetical protein